METTLQRPRLPIAASLNFGELADAYMLAYRGRDSGRRGHRVDFWKARLGATGRRSFARPGRSMRRSSTSVQVVQRCSGIGAALPD
jgi:hypothetical protein